MDRYGTWVFNENGVETFGMDDFTVQQLAVISLPAIKGRGDGYRGDSSVYDIPGYDKSNCVVIITPSVYAGYDQPGNNPSAWGYCPTYVDAGGTKIGIVLYANTSVFNSGSGKWLPIWVANTVPCTIEVFRVL